MGSSTQRRVFDRSTEAFNRHDVEAFKASFSKEVTCTAPGNVRLEGPEAVASFYRSWMDGFPDGRVEIRELHALEDGFVEEGTFSGTHQGILRTPSGDVPPTGRTLSARYIQVVRMRGDRITSFDLVYDRLDLLEQLGLLESGGVGAAQTSEETMSSIMPM